ncbi:MAG: hypothetical protein IIY21_23540 [Clostridiales bacterium]|nr:hypothetical protein [Clostridiales bacterium]
MKKATVLKPFRDKQENVYRTIGDTFSAEDERADYLESLGLVKAEAVAKPKTAPKKNTKKKEAE